MQVSVASSFRFSVTHRITDTLYVDLAKYTETPVSKVRALLNYWFNKAYFHRPTVIVMDNMDKLMGIEQEVSMSCGTSVYSFVTEFV